MASEVSVAFNDLSGGEAERSAFRILGIPMSGLWHTQIWVFQVWYNYVGRIGNLQPPPNAVVCRYGKTRKTSDEFRRFLTRAQAKYDNNYNILYQNCNNFVHDCLSFLLNSSLPQHILSFQYDLMEAPIPEDERQSFIDTLMVNSQQEKQSRFAHRDFFAEETAEIVDFEGLKAAREKKFAVIMYWSGEVPRECAQSISAISRDYRHQINTFAVNIGQRPFLARVDDTAIEISASKLLPWLHPELHHTQLLSSLAPITFPSQRTDSLIQSLPPAINPTVLHQWMSNGKVLYMPKLVAEVLESDTLPVSYQLHILSILATEHAGAAAIADSWESIEPLLTADIDSEGTAVSCFRFLANMYSTQVGIEFLTDFQPIIFSLAGTGLNRSEETVNEAAAAVFFNMMLTSREAVVSEEYTDTAVLLKGVVRRARKPLAALYACQGLVLLACNCEEIKKGLKEFVDVGVPMRSQVHLELRRELEVVIRE